MISTNIFILIMLIITVFLEIFLLRICDKLDTIIKELKTIREIEHCIQIVKKDIEESEE